jgi:preprotein translocase subunit SecG
MPILISILLIAVCVFLILVVIVQNSKGGGLSSTFAASNQIMGVKKTGDVLEKATWVLAGALLLISLFSSQYSKNTGPVSPTMDNELKTKRYTLDNPGKVPQAPSNPLQQAPAPSQEGAGGQNPNPNPGQ